MSTNRNWLRRDRLNRLGLYFKGSSGSSTQTTVQQADPWVGQQPYLQQGFQGAADLYNGGPLKYYEGSTVAAPSDYTNQSVDMLAQRGLNGSAVDSAAQNFATSNLNGTYYNNSNPYLTDTLNGKYLDPTQNTALNAIVDRNAGDITARVQSQFGAAGRTGSGINQQVLERELGDNANQLYGQQYASERNNMTQAAGQFSTDRNAALQSMGQSLALAPQTSGIDFTNINAVNQAGNTLDTQNQAQLTDDVNRYNYNQNAGWDNLRKYIAAIQGNYGGTTTQTSPTPQGSSTAGLLGGAGIGSAIGGGFSNGSGGNYGGWGGLIGAGLGYLL